MSYVAIAAYNLGLAGAIGLAIWVTKSPWPLLGFAFGMSWSSSKKCKKCKTPLICPKCSKDSTL
jgi:hypothetical protein